MKDLKKLERCDINNELIYCLGICVYSGHRPPKHTDIENMVDMLEVCVHKKVEITHVHYDRDGDGLCAWLRKENGEEITIGIKGKTISVGTKKIEANVYGFLQAREFLKEWSN